MSTQEIKAEIDKAINSLSDDALKTVWIFLQNLHEEEIKHKAGNLIQKILKEDTQLLQKLAQ